MRAVPSLFVLVLLLVGLALAHPTIVLGTFESEPVNPQPGEEVTFTVLMEFPTRVPVEQAIVFVELYPEGAPEEAEPLMREQFSETSPGRYQVTLRAPDEGTWSLKLRDQTYPWEDTTARLTYTVGGDGNPEVMDFLFPPTAPAPQSLWTWLFWLVGLPLVAGLIVTVLVMRRVPNPEGTQQQ